MPDLAQDVANRQKKATKALMPPGGTAGRVLTKASPDDYDAEWMPIKNGQALPDGGTVGQVLTKRSYVDGDADWETSSGTLAGSSGYYATGPSATSVPNASSTQLTWPTLSLGAALLDLSAPTLPTVLADGIYTVDATVTNGSPATPLSIVVAVSDGGTGYGAQGGAVSAEVTMDGHLTSFLTAGSAILVGCVQSGGGTVNVTLASVVVTRIT